MTLQELTALVTLFRACREPHARTVALHLVPELGEYTAEPVPKEEVGTMVRLVPRRPNLYP